MTDPRLNVQMTCHAKLYVDKWLHVASLVPVRVIYRCLRIVKWKKRSMWLTCSLWSSERKQTLWWINVFSESCYITIVYLYWLSITCWAGMSRNELLNQHKSFTFCFFGLVIIINAEIRQKINQFNYIACYSRMSTHLSTQEGLK